MIVLYARKSVIAGSFQNQTPPRPEMVPGAFLFRKPGRHARPRQPLEMPALSLRVATQKDPFFEFPSLSETVRGEFTPCQKTLFLGAILMAIDPGRVKALFQSAIERPDLADREAFLDREIVDDAELRPRLDALGNHRRRRRHAAHHGCPCTIETGGKTRRRGQDRRTRRHSPALGPDPDLLLDIDEALSPLAVEDPSSADVARSRLFAELSIEKQPRRWGFRGPRRSASGLMLNPGWRRLWIRSSESASSVRRDPGPLPSSRGAGIGSLPGAIGRG